MSKNIVELSTVTKKYGAFSALHEINLNVRDGEILTLLGPSGCGKTTLMRIIAGFDDPTSGVVSIAGREMNGVMPNKRPVNMVFQRYALFPHLDVFDNVAFGLRLKSMSKVEIKARVSAMLDLVQLSTQSNRWITELSGGQSQRVALARALVNEPKVLLLDEPLAALDMKIRHHMLRELKRIHTETKTTFIYVTHDQDEAMILSDRVVLMNQGKIEQLAEPESMYADPASLFSAQFFGETNIIRGTVDAIADDVASVSTASASIKARPRLARVGAQVSISVRPECITVDAVSQGADAAPSNTLIGTMSDIAFIGSRVVYRVTDAAGNIFMAQTSRPSSGTHFEVGNTVRLGWNVDAPVLLTH